MLFGSQSGNSERLAKQLGKEASQRGFSARVSGMEAIKAAELDCEKTFSSSPALGARGICRKMPQNFGLA